MEPEPKQWNPNRNQNPTQGSLKERHKKAEWNQNQNYIKALEFVRTVKVVNDPAERGIKLATDFSKSLTEDSAMRSLIFQVVEEDRKTKLEQVSTL